jgi:hypothetical protein
MNDHPDDVTRPTVDDAARAAQRAATWLGVAEERKSQLAIIATASVQRSRVSAELRDALDLSNAWSNLALAIAAACPPETWIVKDPAGHTGYLAHADRTRP